MTVKAKCDHKSQMVLIKLKYKKRKDRETKKKKINKKYEILRWYVSQSSVDNVHDCVFIMFSNTAELLFTPPTPLWRACIHTCLSQVVYSTEFSC